MVITKQKLLTLGRCKHYTRPDGRCDMRRHGYYWRLQYILALFRIHVYIYKFFPNLYNTFIRSKTVRVPVVSCLSPVNVNWSFYSFPISRLQ